MLEEQTKTVAPVAPVESVQKEQSVENELRGKNKQVLEQLDTTDATIGSASDRIEFINAIRAEVQAKDGVTLGKAPCAIRLKNLDKAPLTVPVIPYTTFGKNSLADFSQISERVIPAGATFILTLPEFGFLVKDVKYLGKVTGNGKGVGFSMRTKESADKNAIQLPTPKIVGVSLDGNADNKINPLDGMETLSYKEVIGSDNDDYKSLQAYFINKSQRGRENKKNGYVSDAAVNAMTYADLVSMFQKSQPAADAE